MTNRSFLLDRVHAPALAEVLADSIAGDHAIEVRRKVVPDLLERFCRIAEAPDNAAAVETFAKRWGMLGLCEHGLPYLHRTPWCTPSRTEEFQHWKAIAVYFEAMRRIGVALHRGSLGTSTDWGVVTEGRSVWQGSSFEPQFLAQFLKTAPYRGVRRTHSVRPGLGVAIAALRPELSADQVEKLIDQLLELTDGPLPTRAVRTDEQHPTFEQGRIIAELATVNQGRVYYMMLIEQLIDISGLQPRFYWSGGAWNIDMSSQAYSNIPAILTAQLMLRASSAKAQIKCSECPRWFIPRRNQRKYCDRCGVRAAWRVSKRKKRGVEDK